MNEHGESGLTNCQSKSKVIASRRSVEWGPPYTARMSLTILSGSPDMQKSLISVVDSLAPTGTTISCHSELSWSESWKQCGNDTWAQILLTTHFDKPANAKFGLASHIYCLLPTYCLLIVEYLYVYVYNLELYNTRYTEYMKYTNNYCQIWSKYYEICKKTHPFQKGMSFLP